MVARSPLTGAQRVDLLGTIPRARIVNGWQRAFGLDVGDEIPSQEVSHYRCRDTGLEFFLPAEAEGSARLYRALQGFDWYYDPTLKGGRAPSGRAPSAGRWEHQQAIADLAGCRAILEVGCGRGDFIDHCRSAGLDIAGIEINSRAAAEAQARGLDVSSTNLFDLARDEPASRDAVCCFQTLEHIADPRRFLDALAAVVRPGGRLVVAVPNADSYLQYLPDNWLDLPPHHMLRWNRQSLESLASWLPLTVERVATEPLASYNINGWVSANRHRVAQRWGATAARALLNRHAAGIVRALLRAGVRRGLTGHSIYAAYRRRDDDSGGSDVEA